MQGLVLGALVFAMFGLYYLVIKMSIKEDEAEALRGKGSPWDDPILKERPINIGRLEEYQSKEVGEFRFAGLLCDAGAPLVRNVDMRFCLPRPNEYLDFKYGYKKCKGKIVARVLRIDLMEGNIETQSVRRRNIWHSSGNKDGECLLARTSNMLAPYDALLCQGAMEAIYKVALVQGKEIVDAREKSLDA